MTKSELERLKANIFGCERCGVCRHKYNAWSARRVCPAGEHSAKFEPYFPRGKLAVARGILEGDIKYTPELAEVLTWCTSCMNCSVQCGNMDSSNGEFKIKTPEIMEAMRADLYNLGLSPAAYKTVGSRIEKDRNPYGEPKANRMKWAEGLNVSFVEAKKQ